MSPHTPGLEVGPHGVEGIHALGSARSASCGTLGKVMSPPVTQCPHLS